MKSKFTSNHNNNGQLLPISNPQISSRNSDRFLSLHLDKVIFAVAFTYLFAVVSWLVGQQKLQLPFFSKTVTDNGAISNSDLEFIAYMEKALENIDRQLEANKHKKIASPVSNTNPQTTKIIERVYIPFRPSADRSIPAPPSLKTEPTPNLPAPPPLPPAISHTLPIPKTKVNSPVATATRSSHTLVGFLELGDRSVALFKIDGVTQRVRLGEQIGSSGWRLISIVDRAAQIERNSQVRSISTGEKF